jgi:hypothetical protein
MFVATFTNRQLTENGEESCEGFLISDNEIDSAINTDYDAELDLAGFYDAIKEETNE